MIKIEGVKSFGRVGHYERKGLYATEEVLSRITDGEVVTVTFDGDAIRMNSPRYVLFNTNLACVRCGVAGTYFAKERTVYLHKPTGRYWPTTEHYHFNLYGTNRHGHEVMLTKDHTLPKAHGGSDEQDNLETMCAPCNSRKKDRLPNESNAQYAQRRAEEKEREKLRNLDIEIAKAAAERGDSAAHAVRARYEMAE